MNPESTPSPREELEARITALLLGELSPTEAEAVQQAIAQDVELSRLHDRLKQTIEFVRETAATHGHEHVSQAERPTLSPERHEKLMKLFKVIPRPELDASRDRKATWRETAALAAMIVGLLLVAAIVAGYYNSRSAATKAARLEQWSATSSLGTNYFRLAETEKTPVPPAPPKTVNLWVGGKPLSGSNYVSGLFY